jgi:hypothetical protein
LGRELCDFTTSDEKYIDIFWESTFNQSWLYLSEEIVVNWMGYKNTKDTMANFMKTMRVKYVENKDYQQVAKTHELVDLYHKSHSCLNTNGNCKKYYIITGETLKKMLLRAGTRQGDITCDYFIKVESLAKLTNQTIFRYIEFMKERQIQERDNLLEQKDSQLNRLHRINAELLTHKKLSEKNEFIYLVSTEHYVTQGQEHYTYSW